MTAETPLSTSQPLGPSNAQTFSRAKAKIYAQFANSEDTLRRLIVEEWASDLWVRCRICQPEVLAKHNCHPAKAPQSERAAGYIARHLQTAHRLRVSQSDIDAHVRKAMKPKRPDDF